MNGVEHIAGQTFHGRRGPVNNRFTYAVDYVLFDAEADLQAPTPAVAQRTQHRQPVGPRPWRRARAGARRGWVREVLAAHQLEGVTDGKLLLLTQPRVLGHLFNPVSFWLCHDAAGDLRAMIAEVNNTYGDRHSYLCVKPDRSPIQPSDELQARKIFYVSPFQPVEGDYSFHVEMTPRQGEYPHRLPAGCRGRECRACRHPDRRAQAAWQRRNPVGHGAAHGVAPGAGADPLAGAETVVEGRALSSRPTPPAEEVSQ